MTVYIVMSPGGLYDEEPGIESVHLSRAAAEKSIGEWRRRYRERLRIEEWEADEPSLPQQPARCKSGR